MEAAQLAALLKEKTDPDRVVINHSGEAPTPRRALAEHNITPAIIFIRDDGWMLGAPREFAKAAHALWADKWVAVLERIWVSVDYEEWKEKAL